MAEEDRKPVHTLVLDTGAIIKNEPSVSTLLAKTSSLTTVPAIISEIKDAATRSRVETLLMPFLTVRQPSPASMKFVTDFARRTGDLPVLSKPDLQIIALTYELEVERNGGDWRLRKTPGQKELNGPFPTKEGEAKEGKAKESEVKAEGETKADVQAQEVPRTEGEAPVATAETTEQVSAPEQEVKVEDSNAAEAGEQPKEATENTATTADATAEQNQEPEKEVTEALAQTSISEDAPTQGQTESKVDSAQNSAPSQEDSDSDSEGWITPANLKQKQAKDAQPAVADAYPQKTMEVAVLTTDFAMQNVIMQINLNLLSTSLMRIRHVRSVALRCQACFLVTKEMNKQFCPRCGKPTLTRVSCSTGNNGEFKVHLKKNFQYNSRGDRYSIPKAVAGAANGRVKGGGKGGWGNSLILAEDQKEYERALTKEKRSKERNLMDEDYLPGILTGDRNKSGGRIKITKGYDIASGHIQHIGKDVAGRSGILRRNLIADRMNLRLKQSFAHGRLFGNFYFNMNVTLSRSPMNGSATGVPGRAAPCVCGTLTAAGTAPNVSRGAATSCVVRYALNTASPAIALFVRPQSLLRLSRPRSSYRLCKFVSYRQRFPTTRTDIPRVTVNMPTTLKEFEGVFPKLVADLKQHAEQYNLPTQALKWFEESLYYNAVGGKCNRGLSVIDTTQLLLGRDLTQDEYFHAAALGWMIELLQAFFLVSDDIMDSSKTRRGQPCWYLKPGVGMIAINDAFMLESSIFILLKKYFRSHPAYIDLVELFQEVAFQTELGQTCDLLTAPEDNVDLDNFSLEKYSFIVIYKTAYYSFYLPVALAMHYTGKASPENLKQAENILIPMGEYFQVQDDYLDNFADPETLGKIGTDIQDNKCSWLVNQALKKVTPEQRKVLEENYGQKNKECEARVKKLFDELELEKVYQEYEEARVAEIREKIAAVDESSGMKQEVFAEFLRKIYKRSK